MGDTPLIDALMAAGTSRSLDIGDVLCREGDASDAAFVVTAGTLEAAVAGHRNDMVVATHGPGSLVGEVTSLIGGHRTATLRAAEPCTVSVVHSSALADLFGQHPDEAHRILRSARERTDRSRVAAMLSHELQAPDGDAVAAIANRVTWRHVAAGETLFEAGDEADAAFLVVSGRLGVIGVGHNGSTVEVGRGGIVGEFGLLEDRERSAAVIALRNASLARLSATDFQAIAADHTGLAMGLVRRILDRSGHDHTTATTARTFTVAFATDLAADRPAQVVDAMASAIGTTGRAVALDADTIDRALDHPGIADIAPGSFGEVRLAELVHHLETGADHVMLLADDATPNWSLRAVQSSDLLVIVCSPTPDADERIRIERWRQLAPSGIAVWGAIAHRGSSVEPGTATRLGERFTFDEVHHLRIGNDADPRRLARLAASAGVGLVLSGGGARGHAHIGVFRALLEAGVPVDRVVGASMGSIVAGAIGQGLTPAEVERDMRNGADDLLDYTVPMVSLIKGERIVDVLENQFGTLDIADLPVPFSCVSTDLTTAEVVTHRKGSAARMIRTSVSIPGVLPPVAHDDHLLADGGVLNNLPVDVLSGDASIGTIIASDVAPPLGPRAKADHGLSVSGWSVLRGRFAEAVRPGRGRSRSPGEHPGIAGTLLRSLLIGSSRSRDEHIASGAIDLYLQLDLRGIALLDFGQVSPAAERGYESAKPVIDAWLAENDRTW